MRVESRGTRGASQREVGIRRMNKSPTTPNMPAVHAKIIPWPLDPCVSSPTTLRVWLGTRKTGRQENYPLFSICYPLGPSQLNTRNSSGSDSATHFRVGQRSSGASGHDQQQCDCHLIGPSRRFLPQLAYMIAMFGSNCEERDHRGHVQATFAASGWRSKHEYVEIRCRSIHRDLKPANLRLTAHGAWLKILDLGLALFVVGRHAIDSIGT